MAAAAESVSNTRSLRSSGLSGDSLDSTRFRRNDKNLSSIWPHVVRGESKMVPAAPTSPPSSPEIAPQERILVSDCYPVTCLSSMSSPDNSAVEAPLDIVDDVNNNVARAKKPAWKKLSNGASEVGPVMGAESWPALSDSAKASPKASSDSLKSISDGPVSGPVTVSEVTSSLKKQISSKSNPDSTVNHAFPNHPKSMKRGNGGGGGLANDCFIQPQLTPPPQPIVEMPQNNSGNPGPVIPNSSPRALPHKSKSWESGPRGRFISQPHIGNDHPQQRNSFRRGSGGPHLRGDGSSYNSRGGRHGYEWNRHRSFNSRDVNMHHQGVVQRNFIRPLPPSDAPFTSSPPVQPFGNPMGFPDITSPVYYVPVPPPVSLSGVPFVHAAPFAMFLPTPDPQLRIVLANQIDYYFSYENLCKDTYLRKNMDEQGWVPISLIATFKRVRLLTDNIQFILDVVRTSTVVEVQGDKIRKRNDWMTWPLPPPNQSSPRDTQTPYMSNYDMLAKSIESVALEKGRTTNDNRTSPADIHKEADLSTSSGDLNSRSQLSGGEGQTKLQLKQVLGDNCR